MTGAAHRMRRSRARRREGKRVVRVEVDEIALEAVLADLGHLSALHADDPAALEAALAAMLANLCDGYFTVTRNDTL